MSERLPLAERHTFIPTYHLFGWRKESCATLPPQATSLWLERGIDDHLAQHPEEYLLGPKHSDKQQIEEASRRDIPIYVGDAPISRGNTEGSLVCGETITGMVALAATSKRTRHWLHRLLNRMHQVLHQVPKQEEPDHSISLNRRLFLGAIGAYLTLPALERAVQLAAPYSSIAARVRSVNQVAHPEDCPFTLHVRNAIHALMLEYTDEFFQDSHPCSMLGAWHSGLIDELEKTQKEKLNFLREAGVGKISRPSPACWQIHGFSYSKKMERYSRTEIVPVPYLRDLFDTHELKGFC